MAVGIGAGVSLSEIIAEVSGAQTSLQDCFNDATGTFDLTYARGGIDAMSEFQNYSEVAQTLIISPTSRTVGVGAGSFNISVITTGNPAWVATDNVSWITSLSPSSGTGNATITVTYASNIGNPFSRLGTVTVNPTPAGLPNRTCLVTQDPDPFA